MSCCQKWEISCLQPLTAPYHYSTNLVGVLGECHADIPMVRKPADRLQQHLQQAVQRNAAADKMMCCEVCEESFHVLTSVLNAPGSTRRAAVRADLMLRDWASTTSGMSPPWITAIGLCMRPLIYRLFQSCRSLTIDCVSMTPYLITCWVQNFK